MFDYVIVGGGSAGCVLASRLSEDPAIRVALLEAGPVDSSILIHCPAGLAVMAQTKIANWAYETVPQKGLNGRKGYQPRGKVLGGSSSINAMIYARGQHQDYDDWAAEGNAGWAWNDVLPYFKRSEHNERGASDLHGTGGPLNVKDLTTPNRFGPIFVEAGRQAGYPVNHDFNGASQEGVGMYQVTHKNGERWSAAKGYLTPNLGRPNLQVITGAHATRVLFEGKRATGVEYRHEGQLKTIQAAGEVLLSGGAFASPQLLMLSGVGAGAHLQANGISTLHDLPGVGQHLHDHMDAVQVYNAPQLTDLFGLSFTAMINGFKGIMEWRNTRTGMMTTNFAEAGGFIKSSPDESRPDLQFHFVIGKLINHGRTPTWGHGYSCHVCVLRPKSRGSVQLASKDPFAAPLIDPAFMQDADDVQRMVKGFKLMRALMNQPALAGFAGKELPLSGTSQTDAQIEQFIRNNGDTIYHPVGTCRMGNGALDVVDARLRVHGMQNLRVIDASIMPALVSGNTNAPTIMIAEKAVDMIREDARSA
ncbi:choline dehydrogenase [Variovorax sp. PCZ-1]|uniref:GMC family oxidoreductase n=1 Tax=Variovorax sp. PCZ-1 TaxID=2835533 RepID=UPI001BCBC860|nr:choline dehydrogenase [Variovorax sp. PCZ-1]MBS7806258.1 choline dehydrogenase [Variovorax sp. PCZ-1]